MRQQSSRRIIPAAKRYGFGLCDSFYSGLSNWFYVRLPGINENNLFLSAVEGEILQARKEAVCTQASCGYPYPTNRYIASRECQSQERLVGSTVAFFFSF